MKRTKHTKTEYSAWLDAKKRCTDTENKYYPRYGGRGIRMCEEWMMSFEAFYNHIGPKPSKGLSLDRIDNNGHYEPGNVRWATAIEQHNNTAANVFIEFNGESHTIPQWARILNIPKATLWHRIKKYLWTVQRAFTEPIDTSRNWRVRQ